MGSFSILAMTQNLALGSSFPKGQVAIQDFEPSTIRHWVIIRTKGRIAKNTTGAPLETTVCSGAGAPGAGFPKMLHSGFVSGVVCSAAGSLTTRVPKDIMLGCHICTTLFRNGCRGEGTIIIKLKASKIIPIAPLIVATWNAKMQLDWEIASTMSRSRSAGMRMTQWCWILRMIFLTFRQDRKVLR